MNDDLILACDWCGHTTEDLPVLGQVLALPEYGPWPKHCGQPMRLANTTDRDGNTIERTKAIHPANGPEAE